MQGRDMISPLLGQRISWKETRVAVKGSVRRLV